MKTNILLLIVCASALFIVGNANAQFSMKSDAVANLSVIKPGSDAKSSAPIGVSVRTLRNFYRMFSQTEARWYEIDDAYIAKFSNNSVETMVGYGKRGSWLYTIKRFGEKILPRNVREQVKSTYFDYTIIHIDEVQVPKQRNSIYIIHMRDKRNFKTLRVCDQEMEVILEYHEQ